MGVTFQSCDDDDGYSLGDVAVDWATVNVKGAHVYDFTGDRWDKSGLQRLIIFGIPDRWTTGYSLFQSFV